MSKKAWVIDASPLILYARIDRLDLLEYLAPQRSRLLAQRSKFAALTFKVPMARLKLAVPAFKVAL